MKNTGLPIQSVACDEANHYPRHARARAHNGDLENDCHKCHILPDFGGSRAHTYIKKLARTDSAILFCTAILYALYIFLLLSGIGGSVYA